MSSRRPKRQCNGSRLMATAAIGLALGCLPVTVVSADVLMFQQGFGGYSGTRDTYIQAGTVPDDMNFGGELEVIMHQQATLNATVGLLAFDDLVGGGAGQIPAGTTINSATLQVQVSELGAPAPNLYPMVANWGENLATWNNFKLNGNTQVGLQTDNLEAKPTASATLSGSAIGLQTADVPTLCGFIRPSTLAISRHVPN